MPLEKIENEKTGKRDRDWKGKELRKPESQTTGKPEKDSLCCMSLCLVVRNALPIPKSVNLAF